jgi:hypothetical protein
MKINQLDEAMANRKRLDRCTKRLEALNRHTVLIMVAGQSDYLNDIIDDDAIRAAHLIVTEAARMQVENLRTHMTLVYDLDVSVLPPLPVINAEDAEWLCEFVKNTAAIASIAREYAATENQGTTDGAHAAAAE